MTTTQITPRTPGAGVTPRSASGGAQGAEVFDTGRLHVNVAVAGAGVVDQQRQSNEHFQGMREHLETLVETHKAFNTAIGISNKPGEPAPAAMFNFSMDHTSIDKFVSGFTTCLTTATATAVSKQIDDVNKNVAATQQAVAEIQATHRQEVAGLRLRIGELTAQLDNHRREIEGLRRQQVGDEVIGEVAVVATQEQLSELVSAVRYLEGQVYTLTHPTPGQPASGQPTPSQPTPSRPTPSQPTPSQPSPAGQPSASQPASARPSQPAGGGGSRAAVHQPEVAHNPSTPPRGRR